MTRSILYAYGEGGEISPLPASPLLIPAAAAYGALKIAEKLKKKHGRPVSVEAYDWYEQEYNRILPKFLAGEELSLKDHNFFHNIYPSAPWKT